MVSTGNGKVTISNFENLFSGSYTLNNGKELDRADYFSDRYNYKVGWKYGDHYYPYPITANAGSELDATYVVWIKVDSYPSENVSLWRRNVGKYTDASGKSVTPQSQNISLELGLSTAGKLVLSGTGISTAIFNKIITLEEWHQIAIVGKAGNSLLAYIDGYELGNVNSTMTLGYLPPVDNRCYSVTYSVTNPGMVSNSGIGGGVTPCDTTFTLGGWNGSADGLTFFHSALTASQIKELFEKGRHPDPNTTMTPTTRNFSTDGGGGAIITSGSASTWWARVTEPWISLSSNSGNIGYPVAYTVSANTNVEQRIGYVYVSGWVHTVTQDGVGGTISPSNKTFEHQGGSAMSIGFLFRQRMA